MEYHNVKTLQFELWQDCTNNCDFCYLKHGRVSANSQQKLWALCQVYDVVKNLSTDYNAVGLIGGEFFQGQLDSQLLKDEFKNLISFLDSLVTKGRLKQVWVTASFMGDLADFTYCLGNVTNKQAFFICTSYDTLGRFKTEEQKKSWFEHVKHVKSLGFTVHTQVISTQAFIEEALSTDILTKLAAHSMVDFKTPGPYRADYINVTNRNKEWYRELVKNSVAEFGDKFFIKNRNTFLKFLVKVREVFGDEKLAAFCSNEVRSDEVQLLQIGKTVGNRWNSTSENAPCGHPYDSFCYLDSDACARCDAQTLLED